MPAARKSTAVDSTVRLAPLEVSTFCALSAGPVDVVVAAVVSKSRLAASVVPLYSVPAQPDSTDVRGIHSRDGC